MARRHGTRGTWLLALGLGVGGAALVTPSHADALQCESLSTALQQDPTTSEAFTVVAQKELYRFNQRPYVQVPVGVKFSVLAPEGVSAADLHRAAACSIGNDADSPLAVSGTELKVTRNGAYYELHVISDQPKQAREVQRRAKNLREVMLAKGERSRG